MSIFRMVASCLTCFALLLGVFIPKTSFAAAFVEEIDAYSKKTPVKRQGLLLPFAFSSETFETALGVGGAYSRLFGQQQASAAGTVLGSSNGSFLLAGTLNNILPTRSPRLFFDAFALGSRYGALRIYAGYNPEFPSERPGSNESDPENCMLQQAYEVIADARLRYLLPIGAGRESRIHTYWIEQGLLKRGGTDGDIWSPLHGGRTFLSLHPRYQHQFVDLEKLDKEVHVTTLNFEVALEYDNRDFYLDPSEGSYQKIAYTRDFGFLEDSTSWDLVDATITKYVDMSDFLPFRKTVLALDAWTAFSPSWEEDVTESGFRTVSHRPPYFAGARLGSIYRMRGYANSRFTDKSAIYYGGEFRMTPHWNPFKDLPLFRQFDMKWWQLVLIGEVGRVAPHWNLKELHSDMKWDVGVGIRGMFFSFVGRFDILYSEEQLGFAVMAQHPF